jgi:uridine phosphorylase
MDWLSDVPEDDAEHWTAQAFVNYALQSRGLPVDALGVRPAVVVAFQPYVYRALALATEAEEEAAWGTINRLPLAHGHRNGRDLSIAYLPVGAPAAVMYMEALAVGGARTVIAVGAAGSLQEYAPIGAAVLPTSAIREEGTSYHYRPPGVPAEPHPDAVAALRSACTDAGVVAHEGPVWTTDAPFRELTSKVRRMAARGVVAVDMEASAMFIVGAMRGLRVGTLFIVSDELFHPWAPGYQDRGYRAAAKRLAECAVNAAARLAE